MTRPLPDLRDRIARAAEVELERWADDDFRLPPMDVGVHVADAVLEAFREDTDTQKSVVGQWARVRSVAHDHRFSDEYVGNLVRSIVGRK